MRRNRQEDETLNVIIADTDWKTFEELADFKADYNLINLSSDFAVSFIMENEHIDVLVAGKSIARLNDLKKKSEKKKIKMYVLGQDAEYPVNKAEIFAILEYEKNLKFQDMRSNNKKSRVNLLGRLFEKNNHVKKDKENETGQNLQTGHQPFDDDSKSSSADEDNFFKNLNIEGTDFWDDKKLSGSSLNRPEGNMAGVNKKGNLKKAENKEGIDFKKRQSGVTVNPGQPQYFINDKNPSKNTMRRDSSVKRSNDVVAIKQKIIVFIRAKGGVGSTLLSVYLANRFSNLKTLLVDLNFSEGGSDTGYYLDIPRTPNMIIFTEGYNRSSLNNSVINIKNNFDVLQSPPTYELSKKLDLQDIYSLVDVARKKYHLIIFDLPNRIDDICLGVLDLADLAVMVSDFSRGSIGRLTDINNRFIYSDLEKILVFNKNKNGNARNYIKNGLRDFFGVNDIVSLNESVSLCGRSEFDGFNFSSLKEFEPLTEKIMERLTCE
jgi:cellulose biosynthesis protein BcsQ